MATDWRNLDPISPEEQPKLPDRLRVTWLRLADRCDRAAMLSLCYGGGAGSQAMNRGSVFHETVARLTRELIRAKEPNIPPEIAKDVLYEVLDEYPELHVSAVERDALRAMVYNWAQGTYLAEPVIAVETGVQLEIGGFTISGRVDLAQAQGRELILTDYKTSWAMADPEDFKPQSYDEAGNPRFAGDYQTQLYALMMAYGTLDDGMGLGGGYDRFKLRLVYPRYLRPTGLASREVVVTAVQLLDFKIDVEHQLKRLREVNVGQRKWQPTPGTVCRECPAEAACPLPRELRPESQHANLDSIVDLEKAAVASDFLSKRGSALKKRVKAAALQIEERDPEALRLPNGDRGVKCGTDTAFVFVPSESETIRDKAALREAVERGERIEWSDHVRLTEGISFEKRRI